MCFYFSGLTKFFNQHSPDYDQRMDQVVIYMRGKINMVKSDMFKFHREGSYKQIKKSLSQYL
jgi:hypothetical protein